MKSEIQVHIGSVIKFTYPQGDEHYDACGRVMCWRDTKVDPITKEAERRNPIKRSRYLYTLACTDGLIRTFYGGVVINPRHATLLERVWMYVTGVTFPKFAEV